MRTVLVVGLIILVTAIVTGCGSSGNVTSERPMGTVEIKVVLPSGLDGKLTRSISEIVAMRLTITATDMTAVVRQIPIDPATHTGSDRFLVLAGTNRNFLVEALDVSNTVIYTGSALANIPAGVTTRVDVTLNVVGADVQLVVIIHEGVPDLQFTSVPPIGSFDNLTGVVTGGINPELLAVAVYIKVGSGWWTKPYWNAPKTSIKSDGTWVCDITTGGIDSTATEITAYLIWRTTDPPSASGGALPVIADALDTEHVVR